MLRGLRKRAIALLWGGQALSAIGDEIYRVALIWLAVGLVGADAGYLAAARGAGSHESPTDPERPDLCPYYPAPIVLIDSSADPDTVFERIQCEVERVLALGPRS